MPNRPRFINGGIYHVYNRGVEKRDVVNDDRDRARFVHDLYEFNDSRGVINVARRFNKNDGSRTSIIPFRVPGKRRTLVDILAWCIMPNHYHLLLRQRKEKGVSLFMQKLGTGYTHYFNTRYERTGVLFQGGYKLKVVDKEMYLRYLPTYIHLNPMDLFARNWKRGGASVNPNAMRRFDAYRWSSYQDYIGEKNFPSILAEQEIANLALSTGVAHSRSINDWIKNCHEREDNLRGIVADLPWLPQ